MRQSEEANAITHDVMIVPLRCAMLKPALHCTAEAAFDEDEIWRVTYTA